ncbi:hypothetical protein CEXT_789691 [Caerostris extrusa]|uniref:Uncharacterized protein n=1 Tax=Caerostris extrusa TaxID=172846 RepID=A0AAV4SZ56_CAEEX|nr:hypothetical protein CEXT_789691 [Caerostris extrusa]
MSEEGSFHIAMPSRMKSEIAKEEDGVNATDQRINAVLSLTEESFVRKLHRCYLNFRCVVVLQLQGLRSGSGGDN